MRRVPGNREARSRAATIKLTYRVGLPKRHDFGLRLSQWVDEGMLLRSPTLAEVSQWLLGRFERRWSQIPWCPDATRWSHRPGEGPRIHHRYCREFGRVRLRFGHISLPPPALCECRHRSLARRLVAACRRAVLVVPESQRPQPRRSFGRCGGSHDAADDSVRRRQWRTARHELVYFCSEYIKNAETSRARVWLLVHD